MYAGSALLTAGYCLYSSSTIFVLTTGNGVYGFTLDPLVGEFILSHDNVKVCCRPLHDPWDQAGFPLSLMAVSNIRDIFQAM